MKIVQLFCISLFFAFGISKGMEQDFNPELEQKLETKNWIYDKIKDINGNRQGHGATRNCTLCAEEAVRVLSGEKQQASLVHARKVNYDITTWSNDETGEITSHEAHRPEQAELLDFITYALTEEHDDGSLTIDLTKIPRSVKYITVNRDTIKEKIQEIAGTAKSEGQDKTLVGLVHYYFEGYKNHAGHLATFYRDPKGHVFFVDAQTNSISEEPPTLIHGDTVKYEMLVVAKVPKSGYYVKRERAVTTHIKQEEPSNKRLKLDLNVVVDKSPVHSPIEQANVESPEPQTSNNALPNNNAPDPSITNVLFKIFTNLTNLGNQMDIMGQKTIVSTSRR